MPKSKKSWQKSFNLYYAVSAVLVAATAGMAVYSSLEPDAAARLTGGIDTELALFLVPLTLLVFAVVGEVLHTSGRNFGTQAPPRPSMRHWKPGRGEG